jgi:DNA-binding PadR family transcriptional regulator
MASEQWLDRSAQDTYALTAKGRAALQRRLQHREELIDGLPPLPDGAVERLAALLGRLIDASLAAPAPPGSWCLAHSRRRAPARDAAALLQIAQYFSDFNAFRDDAHMAAWKSYKLDGYVWEAFALVCAGEAESATGVFEQLAYRGYSSAEYAAALEALARRSWLEQVGAAGTYRVTAEGREVREVVERLTDSYFYAPWSCLKQAEITELRELLLRFIEDLRASAPGEMTR